MKVLFAGKYNDLEILNGPEKVAKRIFYECSLKSNSVFAEYFFDGSKHSFLKKLFGFEEVLKVNDSEVLRFGLFKFLTYLFKTRPDTIHIITYERFAAICYIYKIFSKVKIIYNIHGVISYENTELNKTPFLYTLKDKLCEYIFMKYSDKLIFLSERSAEMYKNILDIDPNKIEFIPNGVDEVFFTKGKSKNINLKDTLNIIFSGDEIRKEKGFDYLINSFSKINFKLNLYLIGKFSRTFKECNSNVKVQIKERMETNEFAKFLDDKDIYISASSYEQFSITAIETMAAGLVPIVTAETGMSAYIDNDSNGFIVNYGNTEMIVKVLEKLNSDRQKLKGISEKAKNIYNRLSWEKTFERYITLYN